jgi:predicted KAP-like P-loop ATPase
MTENVVPESISIASDMPKTDPAQDFFGYAPFAKRIASAAHKTPSPQGLVMAIHGVWGSGKSSLLNFVKHYLAQLPENEKPIVIDFNPWWFKDSDDLASQFLLLFRKRLVGKSEKIRKIGGLLADYSSSISEAVALSYGIPWLDKPIQFLLGFFKIKPKEVPGLKTELSKILKEANKRFVFVIDDIDRLAPNEIRELFKVIKALADFPNVIYLLSFDRKVVADALNTSLGVDGEAYIEKIVQVPFSLPTVDRIRLRQKLFQELYKILESYPLKNFDHTYWGNVYFEGLDHYIKKPRDIVRVTNSLSVLYPAVVGEINAVDFIALEFLRVFEPEVYGLIWMNKEMFAGLRTTNYQHGLEVEKVFHKAWLDKVTENRQSHVKDLVQRLFPRLESIWGNTSYDDGFRLRWRKEMRVCAPELFDIYFQFGVTPESIRRTELETLIGLAAVQPILAAEILKQASLIKRPEGTSKAREYLERIQDLNDEISLEAATGLINALFDEGDELLSPEDEQGGLLSIPNRIRLGWTINHLLARIAEDNRPDLIIDVVTKGRAIGLITNVVRTIDEYLAKQNETKDNPLAKFDINLTERLHSIVVDRLNKLDDQQLLAIPDLDCVLYSWRQWQTEESVEAKLKSIIESDVFLPSFLEKYLHFGVHQYASDSVGRRIPSLNPNQLKTLTDIFALENRVQEMLLRTDLTENQRIAGEQYVKSMQRIHEGKDPDGFFRDD